MKAVIGVSRPPKSAVAIDEGQSKTIRRAQGSGIGRIEYDMSMRELAVSTIWRAAIPQSLKAVSDGYGGGTIDPSREGELELVLQRDRRRDQVVESVANLSKVSERGIRSGPEE